MATFRDLDIVGRTIVLDGNTFSGCVFKNCRLIFKGEKKSRLIACTSDSKCTWVIKRHAWNTMRFFSDLYHDGPKGRKTVERVLFKQIKKGIGQR